MKDDSGDGIALRCDPQGVVLEVLREEPGLERLARPGRPVREMADESDRAKIDGFLAEVADRQAAFDWEINVSLAGRPVPLHFGGARMEGVTVVVAARDRNGLARLAEELMRINNEQANALRSVSQQFARLQAAPARDDALFDEISRVNNELANLQREMARANRELARLNEDKDRFLGMAAHDLRSPLGVILSYAGFLEDEAGEALTEEQREFVAIIRETSDFMRRLVDDLLDVAQIEAGRLVLDRQPADLAALVRRNAALNGVLASRKGITVAYEGPPAAPPIAVDAGKVEQVLNNLVGNAVKFSQPGTTVRVTVALDESGARVEVRDEGPGIAAQDLPGLFRPFGSGGKRGTAGERGTGLGLAISRRIVEGHGGRIELASEPGHGATFSFTLPRRDSGARVEGESA